MSSRRATRLSYEQSCRELQRLHYLPEGAVPPMPDRRPGYDDEAPLGVHFFRTWVGVGRPLGLKPSGPEDDVEVADHALDNLTLPRTYFGRSEVGPISFRNTDLSESTLCWNDFNDVNFTDADLSRCDLRASIFRGVSFVRANLRGADLRCSSFEECDFTDADMGGAKLTRKRGEQIRLNGRQQEVIDWQESDGEEPPGG